ncbi:DoxX family membrane protein [Flavobacterium microcysteis]
MKTFSQVFLRTALSVSYLSAVADRFGIWGAPGSKSVSWGTWDNFVAYSNSVNSFASPAIGTLLAYVATALEILLPVLLLIGYKLKWVSLFSGVLLLGFALAMTLSFGLKAPLDYSVFTGAAASFLLSTLDSYKYSLDNYLTKNKD